MAAAAQAPQQWVAPTGEKAYPTIQVILGCAPEDGNADLAYKILGLHSRTAAAPVTRPPAHEFVAWCNRLIKKVCQEGMMADPGSVANRRYLEAGRRVRSAIRTIAGIRRPGHEEWQPFRYTRISHWGPNGTCDDAPVDLTIANWDQHVPTPATYQVFQATYGSDRQADKDKRKQDHRMMGKTWMATRNMLRDAREREAEEWMDLEACYGFRARPVFRFTGNDPDYWDADLEEEDSREESSEEQEEDDEELEENDEAQENDDEEPEENNDTQGKGRSPKGKGKDPLLYGVDRDEEDSEEEPIEKPLPYTFFASPVPKGEDSLWYSLSLLVHNRYDLAKKIKFRMANWFHYQLSNPGSRRFRMYCQLLVDSGASVSSDDIEDWGPQDLIRCLNRNDRDAGQPKGPGYHEMLYLIADFFGTEVITFTRPDEPREPWSRPGTPVTVVPEPRYGEGSPSELLTSWSSSPEASPERDGQAGPSGAQPNSEGVAPGKTSNEEGFVLDPKNQKREQILLVTDSKLSYFQPVTRVSPDLDGATKGGRYIGTSPYQVWERWPPMPWWPGAKYNKSSKKWVGDWSRTLGRESLTEAERLVMKPTYICRGVEDLASGRTIQGRYFEAEPPRDNPQNQSYYDQLLTYEADTDTDRYGYEYPTLAVRKTWTTENALAGQADSPLVREQWRARTGGTEEQTYRSKAHSESRKRTREEYAENEGLGYDEDYGWLRIEATEKENKVRAWYDNSKKRRKGMYY
ncbi:hypothetical protein BDP81DRAFT_448472 [Colletotrichum phormii]|uniref:Uncharacterized protein n=1 Tax=Colletotrichum phormii TaxID=359342 RepID=A0AAJ0EFP6_9PEZI|nr:uncharacterized protein BDP81DRAFT_448472 [Colletotrichum phormii]KAK1638437.1 hypothetical protein BDP81DRAFT_448472 [Colletotrichum phormii]